MASEENGPRPSHRTALVTGSSNGIGAAIALRLAGLGYKLVVTGRGLADLERTASECERLSPAALRPAALVADLTNEQDIERLLAESLRHFDGRLDVLVNNAGLSRNLSSETSPSEAYENFKHISQVNLNSAVYLTLLASEPLKRTARMLGEPTCVVNVSSIAGERPLADYAYCVSKAGLNMFTSCMAGALGPEVRVNAVAPGPIETKIIERSGHSMEAFKAAAAQLAPLKRIGLPDEVARAVAFLCDQRQASYVTGAQLNVDGGVSFAQVRW